LKKGLKMSRDRTGVASDSVGLFDLTKDLGLADDHAVE
jgi:hypothetical protein